MINLYQKLGLMPDATEEQIKRAMQQAAEQNRITLDELNKCKIFLLNAENREKYTQKLIEAHPELVDSLLDKMAEPMPQAKVNKKPDTKQSNGKVVIKKKENQDKQKKPFNNTGMHPVLLVLLIVVVFGVSMVIVDGKGNDSDEVKEQNNNKDIVIPDTPVKQIDPSIQAANKAKADDIIAHSEYEDVPIPRGMNASYTIHQHKELEGGVFEAITELRFRSGNVSYSRKYIDCHSNMEKYLGTGEKLEDVFIGQEGKLTEPVEGSTAWYLVDHICSNYRLGKKMENNTFN